MYRSAAHLGGAMLSSLAGLAHAQFLEPDAVALRTFTGTGGFGAAVSELTDITGDGITEAMVSSIGALGGYIDVYNGATGIRLVRFQGNVQGVTTFGWSLADAGDVDGDTVHDIVGGAPNSGAVLIYSGADFSLIHRVDQLQPGEQLGYAVAGIGDINGDGHSEVVAGAPFFDNTGPSNVSTGRAYIINGLDGTILGTILGVSGFDEFGSGTGAIGDITGDGIGDFAVGAHQAGAGSRGAVYVYDGASLTLAFPPLLPVASGAVFGQFFVGRAGDTNNDGTPDIFVGDFEDTFLGATTGRAYVFNGATGSLLWEHLGSGPGQGLGCGRAAGDINFDGFDDIVVGCYAASDGGPLTGRMQILSGIDGSVLRTVTGTVHNVQFGFDSVGVGDVNGDGLIDFLVAGGGGNRGYIVRGENPCPPDVNLDGTVTPADFGAWIAAFNAQDRKADQNADGAVTPADFGAWITNFNAGC